MPLMMHPNVWHEGVFATLGRRSVYNEQGAVLISRFAGFRAIFANRQLTGEWEKAVINHVLIWFERRRK